MPENTLFPPEGLRTCEVYSLPDLYAAKECGTILEAVAHRCSADHTLHFSLGTIHAKIPRKEAIAPWISGADRDISILSRVGKHTCFTVEDISADAKGAPVALLSRRNAQEQAMSYYLKHLVPGMVLVCRVLRLEPFGVFLDIGCGIVGLLPIERISVSRIEHPRQRFREGQIIRAIVWTIDRKLRRITLTHRELLGTWMENACHFQAGETVRGIVRSIKEYGAFIELTPNLSGLSDVREDLSPGEHVSVFIKSIRPERTKIKLQVIDKLPSVPEPEAPRYQITDGTLEHWVYSPPGYEKSPIETDFTVPAP